MEPATPFHLFLMPDGHRRWSESRGLPHLVGHQHGYTRFVEIVKEIWGLASHITFWALSRDNIRKRPAEEITALYELLCRGIKDLRNSSHFSERKVKFRAIRDWWRTLPFEISQQLKHLELETENNGPYVLTLLLAYDGDWELEVTIKRILSSKKLSDTLPLQRAAQAEPLFLIESQHALAPTAGLPPIDLVFIPILKNIFPAARFPFLCAIHSFISRLITSRILR
jgi:undecaprenyl diphosphate synthase